MGHDVDRQQAVGDGENGQQRVGMGSEVAAHPQRKNRPTEKDQRCSKDRRKHDVQAHIPFEQLLQSHPTGLFVPTADHRKEKSEDGRGQPMDLLRQLDADSVVRQLPASEDRSDQQQIDLTEDHAAQPLNPAVHPEAEDFAQGRAIQQRTNREPFHQATAQRGLGQRARSGHRERAEEDLHHAVAEGREQHRRRDVNDSDHHGHSRCEIVALIRPQRREENRIDRSSDEGDARDLDRPRGQLLILRRDLEYRFRQPRGGYDDHDRDERPQHQGDGQGRTNDPDDSVRPSPSAVAGYKLYGRVSQPDGDDGGRSDQRVRQHPDAVPIQSQARHQKRCRQDHQQWCKQIIRRAVGGVAGTAISHEGRDATRAPAGPEPDRSDGGPHGAAPRTLRRVRCGAGVRAPQTVLPRPRTHR